MSEDGYKEKGSVLTQVLPGESRNSRWGFLDRFKKWNEQRRQESLEMRSHKVAAFLEDFYTLAFDKDVDMGALKIGEDGTEERQATIKSRDEEADLIIKRNKTTNHHGIELSYLDKAGESDISITYSRERQKISGYQHKIGTADVEEYGREEVIREWERRLPQLKSLLNKSLKEAGLRTI